MHALSRIHRSLKPDGVLLDLQPQPQNSRIEVWHDGRIHRLGEVDQREDHLEIQAALVHLSSFEQAGLFATEKQAFFELLEHHPTVESWQKIWAEEGYRLVAEPELLNSARELLGEAGSELVIREPVRATSLRRLEGDGSLEAL